MKMYLPPPGARDSRRGFLKKGLFGGLVLALGGAGWLVTRRSAQVNVPSGLQVLDAQQFAVVSALVPHFVPKRDGFPDPMALEVPKSVDGIIARVDDTSREELKQLLALFENALPNFLFGLRTTPFTQMSPDEQAKVVDEWRTSALTVRRTGYLALRTVVMGAYYGNPATWAAVKYPGPPKGIHDPGAPQWRGGGEARPVGNGTWVEPQEATP